MKNDKSNFHKIAGGMNRLSFFILYGVS